MGAPDECVQTAAADVLRALAEPRRRAILQHVAQGELAAGEIAAAFEVTRSAVSQHLAVLKKAGLLAERREGTRRLYRVRSEGLDSLRAFLEDGMWAPYRDLSRPRDRLSRSHGDSGH